MISEKLKQKINLYEQMYFGLDTPVPFKGNLYIYPILVKDYYRFYSNLSCLTMDKMTKKEKIINDKGMQEEITVSNPEGISMSYMQYLISQMESKDFGTYLTAQVINLFELVFHIKNGFFCPNCSQSDITYEEIGKEMKKIEKSNLIENEKELAKQKYFYSISRCPHCGEMRREIFSIKDNGKIKKISIYNEELNTQEFDEFIAIVLHYNILDYDGDEYIDPKLKEDLEIKRRLENKNYNSPSLEKQLVCVSISSPYTIEQLKELTLRKLTLMLKTIDAKNIYYAQMQGLYSGMVKFKEDPKHWIFSDNSKDFSKEIMTLEDVQKKFAPVTGG